MKGKVFKPKGRPTWYFITDVGADPATGKRKQRKQGGFKTKGEAERALASVVTEVSRGSYKAPSKQTVGEFLTDWLASVPEYAMRANTRELYRVNIEHYIVPRIGAVHLQHLDHLALNRLYGDLMREGGRGTKPLAPKTVRNVHVTLRRALEDSTLALNPAAKANPPSARRVKEMKTFTGPELFQVLSYAKTHNDPGHYTAFVLLASTGMRRSEVLGLRWQDVDFARGVLSVSQGLTRTKAGVSTLAPPKTASGQRTVAIPPETVGVLRRWKLASIGGGGLVFSEDPAKLSAKWKSAAAGAGVAPVPLHGLRHTFATLALEAGVAPKVVQEQLGHSSIQVTSDIYQHVSVEVQRQASTAVAGWLK